MFTSDNLKSYVTDIKKAEVEIVSFVDRTTEEAGHFATVKFQHLETGLFHELTVLKGELASWLKTKADDLGHVAKEALNDGLQAVVDVVTAQGVDSEDRPVAEIAVDLVAKTAENAIDASSLNKGTKVVLDTLVETASTVAKDKLNPSAKK